MDLAAINLEPRRVVGGVVADALGEAHLDLVDRYAEDAVRAAEDGKVHGAGSERRTVTREVDLVLGRRGRCELERLVEAEAEQDIAVDILGVHHVLRAAFALGVGRDARRAATRSHTRVEATGDGVRRGVGADIGSGCSPDAVDLVHVKGGDALRGAELLRREETARMKTDGSTREWRGGEGGRIGGAPH